MKVGFRGTTFSPWLFPPGYIAVPRVGITHALCILPRNRLLVEGSGILSYLLPPLHFDPSSLAPPKAWRLLILGLNKQVRRHKTKKR